MQVSEAEAESKILFIWTQVAISIFISKTCLIEIVTFVSEVIVVTSKFCKMDYWMDHEYDAQ